MQKAAFLLAVGLLITCCQSIPDPQKSLNDPLPSWNDGPAKRSILEFAQRVTREDGSDFVRESERIAVFDNDGTLWTEQPYYVQLVFAMDRVRHLAPDHPEWKTEQPFLRTICSRLRPQAFPAFSGWSWQHMRE